MIIFFRIILLCFLFFIHETAAQTVHLNLIGTYKTGVYNKGGAEITAYDAGTKRLFVVNGDSATIDVLSIADPVNPALVFKIYIAPYGGGVNSVYAKNGIIAAAVQNNDVQADGSIVFFDVNGNFLNQVIAGALPDNIVWSPDGNYVLTANEGEPNSDYSVDPPGSVTIADVSNGINNLTQANVTTVNFSAFNNTVLDSSIRIYGPNATVASDFEPEYVAISPDSRTAWVTLQENNAIATIDIVNKTILSIKGLGYKDHSLSENKLDASDADGGINIRNWPVYGVYMPDEMRAYSYNGSTCIVMANEGDSRVYSAYSEELRATETNLDSVIFPKYDSLWLNKNLGKLKFTRVQGFDGTKFTRLYSLGARSFTIRDSLCNIIFDSGDQFEQILASHFALNFNASNTSNAIDNRSDDKGPEPEGITVAKIGDSTYAFIGLERMSGVMVYNITNPASPYFVEYSLNRDFTIAPGDSSVNTVGDLGPEGLIFIPANESPVLQNLLVVSNETSGTVSIYSTNEGAIPVELTSFSVSIINNKVNLGWKTATELNNNGFEIERNRNNSGFEKIAFIQGRGTTTEKTNYSFTDESAGKDASYKYRLKQLDYNGNFTYSNILELNFNLVNRYSLSQNYPNPFNPTTNFEFRISDFGFVKLKVYDVLGKEVTVLVNEEKEPGIYNVIFNASELPSGTYFYTLSASGGAGDYRETKKLLLLK